jgi:hypothetical protein
MDVAHKDKRAKHEEEEEECDRVNPRFPATIDWTRVVYLSPPDKPFPEAILARFRQVIVPRREGTSS